MPAPNILVVVVDGLRASALGAYGNASIPTPALDRFAADSLLLDWCLAPSVDLADVYRAFWQSAHPARPLQPTAASLTQLLTTRGYTATLVTDEPQLAKIAAAGDFDQCLQLHDTLPAGTTCERANDVAHTSMARLFGSVCDLIATSSTISDSSSPRFIWAHSRGMYGPWDAPLDVQDTLLDEGDPPPLESAKPPDLLITPTDDPDVAFRLACAYAAQAIVLDECWDGVLQTIEATASLGQWLVMLIGARGYPLGEHNRVGGVDPRLYAEQLHVPWLVRLPEGSGRLARIGQLASHLDLKPTLLAALDRDAADDTAASAIQGANILPLAATSRHRWRDSLVAAGKSGARAIRTTDWSFRQDSPSSTDGELYVRPDDRWEANDVAKLCPDVVEALAAALSETVESLSGLIPAVRAHDEPS